MNRNQLMAFTIAYETRNLVRTADRLYVSQSAVSQQLKKLEDELHTELFVHKKGQIVPNEYGDLFYPYAKEALAALARGEETLHRRQQADQKLVIYLYSYNGNSAISRAVRIFQQTHADLRLDLRRLSPPGGFHLTEQALYFFNESWIRSPNVHFVPLSPAGSASARTTCSFPRNWREFPIARKRGLRWALPTWAHRRPPWRNFSPASRPSLQNAMPCSCPAGNKGGSCTLRIAMNFCSRSFDGLEHKTVRDVKKDWTSGMAGIVWLKLVDKTSFPHHTAKREPGRAIVQAQPGERWFRRY